MFGHSLSLRCVICVMRSGEGVSGGRLLGAEARVLPRGVSKPNCNDIRKWKEWMLAVSLLDVAIADS